MTAAVQLRPYRVDAHARSRLLERIAAAPANTNSPALARARVLAGVVGHHPHHEWMGFSRSGVWHRDASIRTERLVTRGLDADGARALLELLDMAELFDDVDVYALIVQGRLDGVMRVSFLLRTRERELVDLVHKRGGHLALVGDCGVRGVS